jgi:hypothetical protein
MLKKNNLAVFAMTVIGFLSLLTSGTIAQKTVSVKTDQLTTSAEFNILQKYIEVSSILIVDRQKVFIDASKEDKASLFRFHLAFQFVRNSELNQSQKDLILESISDLSSDDYDTTKNRTNAKTKNEAIEIRAGTLFSDREVFEVFEVLGSDKSGLETLKKYQAVVSLNNKEERDGVFKNYSSEDKRLYWKVKLAVTLASLNLDKQKQDFILEAISLLENESVQYSSSDIKTQNLLDEFMKRALEVFPKEQVYRIFISLIGEAPPCSLANQKTAPATTNLEGNCNCRSSFYCSEYVVKDTACKRGCSLTPDGCGLFGSQSCVGQCKSTAFPDLNLK